MATYDDDTALLVVDVQNDFADPRGTLYVTGAQEMIPLVNEEIERALEAGAVVVYTQDWHPETTPHFSKDGGVWPAHCVMGTWGAKLHPDLIVAGEVVRKGSGGEDGYSGFSVRAPHGGEVEPTRLRDVLERHGIERVVVIGLATDYCVKETALDALDLGYPTVVRAQAVRAVDLHPGDGRRALELVAARHGTIE